MKRRRFDPIRTPLQSGRTLIEASAGTGKTHTIAAIVLRLIVENDLLVREILVTTYTELATAELRDRIRRLMRAALLAFQGPAAAKDQPNELIAVLLEHAGDRRLAASRLNLALQTFDEAPIYTIHGFCQRMLKDHAFESGGLFDAELIMDQTRILREIVDDFWRRHFYERDPVLVALLDKGLKPQKLLDLLLRLTNNPTLVVEPAIGGQFEELLRRLVREANENAASDATKECLSISLQAEFLAWARTELKRRKVAQNLLSFDDMLTRLRDSLGGAGGGALAASIRGRFKAALIDEFQDTDPIQYEIFQEIYREGDCSHFFIGDPKQAIYGFRGADVFTYIGAAQATVPEQQFTLGTNWRSEAGLVEAVNAVFKTRQDPFVLEGIGFEETKSAGKADLTPLTFGKIRKPPLQVWRALAPKPLTVPEADKLVLSAVPAEIARLLDRNVRIGETRVEPQNIAILVRRNKEAQMMQDALRTAGIPSVLYAGANVFKSREALELERVLTAVIEPAHDRLIKAALTTEMMGLTGESLQALSADESAWEERILRFQGYHLRWRERGFIQMLRTLILEEQVRERLLGFPNGERRLTNLLHLAELLHRLCEESRMGMGGLVKRLGEQIRNRNAGREEEYELRLERDEKAVRIVTVHRSKGLEYDIVFCPYSWRSQEIQKNDDLIFHEKDRLILDLEKNETNRAAQRRESLAEELRLFYVALTRARHRCYFVCGNFPNEAASAPGYLLGAEGGQAWEPTASALQDVDQIELLELDSIKSQPLTPAPEDRAELAARSFSRALDRSYGIASFTRLITGREKEPLAPEYDTIEAAEVETASAVEAPLAGIFAFPRGTAAGTCLHHIFEELDFADLGNLAEIVRRRLRAFSITGFDEIVCEMVRKVLNVPLQPGLTLAGIDRKARLPELEFYFPIRKVTSERLADLLQDGRLLFQPMSGFMKGFIDLVFEDQGKFYIVDWKSNWLGAHLESYAAKSMAAEMESKFYNLQLHIYVVALHRFLRARLPGYDYEKHFGEGYYVFLRGVEPSRPELGVHRARPSAKFVESLSQLLGP